MEDTEGWIAKRQKVSDSELRTADWVSSLTLMARSSGTDSQILAQNLAADEVMHVQSPHISHNPILHCHKPIRRCCAMQQRKPVTKFPTNQASYATRTLAARSPLVIDPVFSDSDDSMDSPKPKRPRLTGFPTDHLRFASEEMQDLNEESQKLPSRKDLSPANTLNQQRMYAVQAQTFKGQNSSPGKVAREMHGQMLQGEGAHSIVCSSPMTYNQRNFWPRM